MNEHGVTVALVDPFDLRAADDLRFAPRQRYPRRRRGAGPDRERIKRYYGSDTSSMETFSRSWADDGDLLELRGDDEPINVEAEANATPIIRFVDLILFQAIQDRASDIHFEPFEHEFKIRYRVDGALYEMAPPPRHLALPVISRVKVMANMNIAERRLPQDGRIQKNVGGRMIDMRVSTLPTQFGESVVLRVLDRSTVNLDLEALGMPDYIHDYIVEVINRPNGIFIVTGPTGSGKTTTLYSCLRKINTIDSKLLTAEEPVEYDLEGVVQVPVNEAIGLSFARVLRAFLRQDPDRIMVGETRDLETAQIAIQASLTGHPRLHHAAHERRAGCGHSLDRHGRGAVPDLVHARGGAGQRLLRSICPNCRTPYQPTQGFLDQLGLSRRDIGEKQFFYGKGCDACNNTGYKGPQRHLRADEDQRSDPRADQRAGAIRCPKQKAVELGMVTLRQDGLRQHFRGRHDNRRSAEIHVTGQLGWLDIADASRYFCADLPMPRYNYVALDARGQESTGLVEAASTNDAIGQLRQAGYFPTNVFEEGKGGGGNGKAPKPAKKAKAPRVATPAAAGPKKGIVLFERKTVKPRVLMIFTRQLATLIDAGLPLLRALTVLAKQERDKVLAKTITNLSDSVQGGSTFSEGLAQHPRVFNDLYVNMVRAGELGGVLELVLTRLAEFQEKAQKIKNKVKSAMVYPIIVMFLAIAILSFLLVFIVPKFEMIFQDMLGDKPLPGITRFVIAVSNAVKEHWMIIGGLVVLLVFAVKFAGRTAKGRAVIDRLKLRTPLFGDLLRKTAISRFARTLGTLVTSGVPILQALNITRETAGNMVIAAAITKVHDAVKEGESIVQPLESSGAFPPMVVSMIDVGEETGQLPEMLLKIAEVYDDEVDNSVAGLTSMLEPIMIVFLALVVGTIVIALFMPLISIISGLQQQT
jgi:type II secretion system protein F